MARATFVIPAFEVLAVSMLCVLPIEPAHAQGVPQPNPNASACAYLPIPLASRKFYEQVGVSDRMDSPARAEMVLVYDLRRDPLELNNVAEDPAYADAVRDLDARLMAELKATGDPRAAGRSEEFERYPSPQPKRKPK